MTNSEFENTIVGMKEKLFHFALSYLRNKEEAQDVVQDVVLKLWEKRKKVSLSKNVESFCMSSVKNQCLDLIRRKKQYDNYTRTVEAQVDTSNYENKELVELLKIEIQQLPVQQRICIELKDFRGYDYEEISDMLDISVNAIRANVSRGRKRLYELLKEEVQHV